MDRKPKAIVSDDAIQFEKQHWSSTGSFKRRPNPGWNHNEQDLTGGFGVAYSVMFCGFIGVKKSLSTMNETTRTAIIRESILRVLHFSGIRTMGKKQLKKPDKKTAEFIDNKADISLAMNHVNLIINSEKFLTSFENGKKMLCHGLNDVSFVATGIEATADYIGYVSRDKNIPRACFVFDCLGNSQPIANTMTQAFEIKLKEMLHRNNPRDLTSNQGMLNGGWGEEHLYADGAGSWKNTALPSVPAAFDDNIYEGVNITSDPLYDNKGNGALRGDKDIYDNRPDTQSIGYSEKGIYDNSTNNLGRIDCEAEYDNCPKMEAEDYLEGLLKQNIYDNNVRAKVPSRIADENPYDNKDTSGSVDTDFSSHSYGNITDYPTTVVENVYDSGDPVYDNKSGEGGDRRMSQGIYDNHTGLAKEMKSPLDSSGLETGAAFGESPYDNSPNFPLHVDEDETYTKMESLKRTEITGLYDNKSGVEEKRAGEEALYDLAENVILPETPEYVIHEVNTTTTDNGYDKLTNLYDTPFDNTEKNREESIQIYDNALPNDQTVKSSATDLATELIYDNNKLIQPMGIELMTEVDDFVTNPVYGMPEDCLSPLSQLSNHTAEAMFDGQLAQPKKPTVPSDFEEGAIYGEGLVTEVKQAPDSSTKILPVNSLPFFHGLLSRKDCEALLIQNGDFLMRESQSKRGQYVISGLHLGKYQHLLFLSQEGKVQTKEREFSSISHLVAYYMKTKDLLSTGSNNLSLLQPIIAIFPESDIYTMMN